MRKNVFLQNSLHKSWILLSLFISFTFAHTTPFYIKRLISNNRITAPRNRKPAGHNRVDAEEALRMLREQSPYNQPCIPDFVKDHDASRIPAVLPHMPCPKGTGDRCIEIQLPMHVLFHSSNSGGLGNYHQDKLESKLIYVPSGCYENKKPRHPLQTAPKSNARNEKLRKKGSRQQHKIPIK